jgi:hypothetical protein
LAETNTLDDEIIVIGTKETKHILDAYEECFGQEFDHSIVSKKKGKIELDPNLDFPCMKPVLDKCIRAIDTECHHNGVKEHHLSSHNLKNL